MKNDFIQTTKEWGGGGGGGLCMYHVNVHKACLWGEAEGMLFKIPVLLEW